MEEMRQRIDRLRAERNEELQKRLEQHQEMVTFFDGCLNLTAVLAEKAWD